MKVLNLLVVLWLFVLFVSKGAAAILIDLDISSPGIQTSRNVAFEGETITFAVIATNFPDSPHCINGIGIDVSFRGTMTGTFGSLITAGPIAGYTNEGFSDDLATGLTLPLDMSLQPFNPSSPLGSVTPLPGFTDNIGGVGMIDPPSNLNGMNQVVSYTGVPSGGVTDVTILQGNLTLTNIVGNTFELFPSGIFVNPMTTTGGGGVGLPGVGNPSIDPYTNFTIAQGGDVLLHSEPHARDPNCANPGFDTFQGAALLAVPEPGTVSLLLGAIGLLCIRRRQNSRM